MQEQKEQQLPEGWKVVRLGDFVEKEKGKKPKNESTEQSSTFSIPYIDIQAFEEKIIKSWTDGLSCRLCNNGDLLMVWDGSRSGLVGKGMDGALGSTLMRINFPTIHNPYAFYFLQSKYQEINTRAKGSGTPHVDPDLLWNYDFPIAPIEQQKQIIEKIEELFSELDSGVASLKTAQQQLKLYRQSLLKHAFEGKLTEQWRKDNADKLETPEQLLVRIQTERQVRYQQQLEEWQQAVKDWEAQGKEGKKPSKPRQLEKSDEINTSNLIGRIPDTWQLEPLGNIFSVFVGATPSRKQPDFWNGDIHWVSSGEVAFCNITSTKEKITQLGYENTSTEIHPIGTVLLAMIGEGKTRGQAAILKTPAAHNQNTAAIRVTEAGLPAEYAYHFFQYQYEQTRRVGSGNNQKALNKNRVSGILFPLCSLTEQQEIVNQLEEKLSIIEQNEKEIKSALAKAELLRQSILKKAFSGSLIS